MPGSFSAWIDRESGKDLRFYSGMLLQWGGTVRAVYAAVLILGVAGCSGGQKGGIAESLVSHSAPDADPLPGMPPVLDSKDIYAADRPGLVSPTIAHYRPLIYVPNSKSDSVDEIDPETFKIVRSFRVGKEPQHVTPSWDLKTLWVLNDLSDSLTRIDPVDGKKLETIKVEDPYNMYYTPNGKFAIVVCERKNRLDFRNAQTMKTQYSVPVPCKGVDHMDFSANGRYLLASCEFSAEVVKVDVEQRKVVGVVSLEAGGMPQDVKLSPDGKVFYVADMEANGVYLLNGEKPSRIGFVPTGKGAHGLYVSRDSTTLYVSNRGEGSISLIDLSIRKVAKKWVLPGGGSPDMGGVSADGKVLWLSGRYHREVYAISTEDGHLIKRIKVGKGPHGLCVYPQPGRYSLGHTGIFR